MKTVPYHIAVFASGQGTNAERVFSYFENHAMIRPVLLVSSSPQAPVLEIASKFAIPTRVITRPQLEEYTSILNVLSSYRITHIILAGFLWRIPVGIVDAYRRCIVNIHPSLLPRYGGKGMYGNRVHEEVKRMKERETGITIHMVNEQYDEGAIIFQARCTICPTDLVGDIARKVQQLEHVHYARIIELWIQKKAVRF